MTTELVLLMAIAAYVLFTAVLGDSGIRGTFAESSPRLAARLERNLATGVGFRDSQGETAWLLPDRSGPP